MPESKRPLLPVQPASTISAASSQARGPIITTASTGLLAKRPTCSQCRIRKVKCDGQQDICGNCQRLRFECSFQQTTSATRSEYVLKVPEARRRMQACIPCHDKKTRCLGELPSCTNCLRKGRTCVYPRTKKGPSPTAKGKDLEQQSPNEGPTRLPRPGQDESPDLMETDDAAVDPSLALSLIDDYFRHLYPLPSYSFLHKPTVIQRCKDDTINQQLQLAICAITALQLQRSSLCHELWVDQAERTILQDIGQPSIFHLQALFLIVRYRIESGKFPTAFMLAGLAARTAVALRLNYERSDLSYVAQEARRRLYWSLYLLDDYFCVGLREFELCPEETINLQLPCNEEMFETGGHSLTGSLHPDPAESVTTGLHGSYIRVTSARRANMRFIRKVSLGEESPETLRHSINSLEQRLFRVHAGMGVLAEYSVANMITSPWQAEYLMLHISWHQCHCDLYRSFIDSYSEAAPVAVLQGLHPEERALLQQRCVQHAETIIQILSDFSAHGNTGCQLERDVAVCAFEAARIVMFKCRRTGLVADMQEAIGKAKLCLTLITRHFTCSASTRPLWKELERLISNYTVQAAVQTREVAPESGPPSPRSTRLSQIATARQKLSVQSLLLQSDFVDDSDEIAYPETPGERATVPPPSAVSYVTTANNTQTPLPTAVNQSMMATTPNSATPLTEDMVKLAYAPDQLPARLGAAQQLQLQTREQQQSWTNGTIPDRLPISENQNVTAAVPADSGSGVATIASSPSMVVENTTTNNNNNNNSNSNGSATAASTAMITDGGLPPAMPGFDPTFVFNPWMGFSGNEDLRAYYEPALGLNEEY